MALSPRQAKQIKGVRAHFIEWRKRQHQTFLDLVAGRRKEVQAHIKRIRERVQTGALHEGIDISGNNAALNYDTVAASKDFIVAKVTEGHTFHDPSLTSARVAALTRVFPGANALYHFARSDTALVSPEAEADWFVDQALKYGFKPSATGFGGKPNLVLDYETHYPGDDQTWVDRFSAQVNKRVGFRPGLYSGFVMRDSLRNVVAFDYVWDAAYPNPVFAGFVPADKRVLHQYSDRGSVNGAPGLIDLDRWL